MFGFANLGNDDNAEWGYITLQELKDIKIRGVFEVDFDKHLEQAAGIGSREDCQDAGVVI